VTAGGLAPVPDVRSKLVAAADRIGVRRRLAHSRNRLVDVLTGEAGSEVKKRNTKDDWHLSLLLAFGLRPDSNCLDVGANYGRFLRDFCRVAPNGRHLAYEPIPALCDRLCRLYPTIDVRRAALANTCGTETFVHVTDTDLEAYSGFREQSYPRPANTETIEVEVRRLDDDRPPDWLPDFVKIDVEGAEGVVVAGALETLRASRPVIAFEHGRDGSEAFGVSDADLYRTLCEDVGLRIFDMDGNGPLSFDQFEEEMTTRWNWVAHP
jgi:FkbM family methyltransferase